VGIRLVAEMLHGGEARVRAERSGLDRLSTWGLLSKYRSEWIVHLLRRLITGGLVGVSGGDMPLVHLTAAGREVMHDRAPARVLLPPPDAGEKKAVRKAGAAAGKSEAEERPATPADARLFDRLKETRLALARSRGVAAYLICHDRTLREIAQRRPGSRSELAAVYGMGPSRIETCGDDFLAVVARDR
jgi:ATP-dependent DNA helicase RecQ